MKLDAIYALYQGVMLEEAKLRQRLGLVVKTDGLPYLIHEQPEEVYAVVWRLFENTKSEFISRSYNSRYNLCDGEVVFESVAAHANLMGAIMTHALDYYYGGATFGSSKGALVTVDGFSYREIMEAVRLHDLAENEIGDIPDNGERNEAEKTQREFDYFQRYMNTYGSINDDLKQQVLKLLYHMQQKDTPTGRMMFLADKISASIATLCLDFFIKPPMMHGESPDASERDLLEMSQCSHSYGGYFRASEMWAMDFLEVRRQAVLDETLFFTGLLAMATIVVNGEWYCWRNGTYSEK